MTTGLAFWRLIAVAFYFCGLCISGMMVLETWAHVRKKTVLRGVLHAGRAVAWPALVVSVIAYATLRRLAAAIGLVRLDYGPEPGQLVELRAGNPQIVFKVRVKDDEGACLSMGALETDLSADERDKLIEALAGE